MKNATVWLQSRPEQPGEERLCVDRLLGRLRFTCAHELGHWVLHQKLYSGTGDVAAMKENIFG